MEKTKILVFLIVHFVGALITIIIDCLNGRMEMAIKKGDGIRLETPSDVIFLDLVAWEYLAILFFMNMASKLVNVFVYKIYRKYRKGV